jgi:hypothetical protein
MRSIPRQKSWEINNATDDFIDSLNQYHGYAIHSVTEWPIDLYESSQTDRLLHNHHSQCHVIRTDTSVRLIAKRIFRLDGSARAWSIRLCEFDPVVRRTTTVAQSINCRTRNRLVEAYCNGDLELIPPAST